jgi:hypothetical protein
MDMVEIVARAIAKGLGYDWDTLYAGKTEWVADRGSRHDINTPYKPDFTDAARAAIEAMRTPSDAMLLARWPSYHPWGENAPPPEDRPSMYAEMVEKTTALWGTMIDTALSAHNPE